MTAIGLGSRRVVVEPTAAGFDPDRLSAIGPLLAAVVDGGERAGFVTSVWRHGHLAWCDAVGERDRTLGLPMERDSIFALASMSKPIASVALLLMVEDGKARLDDPIARWLPEFCDMRVMIDPDGPLERTVPVARAITIEDLLTHRAGFGYGFALSGPLGRRYEELLGDPLDGPYVPDEWLRRLATLPLVYQPGERMFYSHATDVAGYLAGRIAGTSFPALMRERIFEPLGMLDTACYVPPEKLDRVAHVYANTPAGLATIDMFAPRSKPPRACSGGSALYSTAYDYLTFARLLLGDGEVDGVQLLSAPLARRMRTDHLTAAQHALPFLGIDMWAGQGFGLGVSVVTDPTRRMPPGIGNPGAFGWPGAFGVWWQADPAEDMVLLCLSQHYEAVGPDMGAEVGNGQQSKATTALIAFQEIVYDAIQR